SEGAAAPLAPPRPEGAGDSALRLFDDELELTAPIRLDGEVVGTVQLRSDLARVSAIIDTYLVMAGLVVLLLVVASVLIAARLQKLISAPILDLLRTMQRVAGEQDYGVRARRYGDDELGQLATGFNRMLERIQSHDERLSAAYREAEAASRAKTEFLANMSHELRTPLNAIIGFSEILKAELLGPLGSERYRFYAQDIHDSGHHLLEVINDILDISKVEAGEFELQEQSGDLRNIVAAALRLVRERAESAGIAIEVSVEEGVPEVWIDRRLIKQGVINLLSNAVKFSPEPGTVSVRLARTSDGGLRLSVSDRGIGIAEGDVARVLQPFAQVESAYARSHEGTGLGLPLAKSFIEAHGGRLEIDSRLGEGTTVTLYFPPERVIKRDKSARARPAE
ncbi:MAG TPA: HAMP domain-containing sensor histidine kinase, partial [Kiloniellales bacterium]|nr:HAMP domain-containing sensor histidine kinase [Kiloniellales bacterium]